MYLYFLEVCIQHFIKSTCDYIIMNVTSIKLRYVIAQNLDFAAVIIFIN